MNLPHLHLLLNHIPTIGFGVGVGLLLLPLFRRNDSLRQASLEVLFIVALLTLPAYLSGYSARAAIAERPDVTASIIQAHADAALLAFLFMQLTGAVAWIGLWQSRRMSRPAGWTMPALMLLSVVTFGLMARAANEGGDIRHPEIKPAAARAETEQAAESEIPWLKTEVMAKALVVQNPVVWQVCETLHFIGLSFLLGVVLLLDLRLLGVGKAIPIAGFYTLLPWAMIGYGINTLTGILWVAAGSEIYMGNPAFYFKILWVVLAGVNTLFLTVADEAWLLASDQEASARAKLLAAASIFLWLGVVFWGRLMPFLGLTF